MTDPHSWLAVKAVEVDQLRVNLLFTDESVPIEENPITVQYLLLAIGALEQARSWLKLCRLHLPPALPVPPPLEHPAPVQEGVGSKSFLEALKELEHGRGELDPAQERMLQNLTSPGFTPQ